MDKYRFTVEKVTDDGAGGEVTEVVTTGSGVATHCATALRSAANTICPVVDHSLFAEWKQIFDKMFRKGYG